MSYTQEVGSNVLQSKDVVSAVDEGLTMFKHREVVTGREFRDLLLDIRLIAMGICTSDPEQGELDGDKLQEGTPAIAGVHHPDAG